MKFSALLAPLALASQNPLVSTSHHTDLLSLHKSLVSISSVTGNETFIGNWLASYLEARDFTVTRIPVSSSPERFNLLAHPSSSKQTRILLSSHIDTVPPFIPYQLDKAHGLIGGRGSNDDKGSIAAQIVALTELLAEGAVKPADAGFLFVVGEETGGDGMVAASDWLHERGLKYDAVLFGEPTEGKLVCGHKGLLGFKLVAKGKAAHSGYPWLGVSANSLLIQALAALEDVANREKGGLPRSEKYGATTLNVGRIEGGVAMNVVSEHAVADVAVRIAAGNPKEILSLISATVHNATEHLRGKGGLLTVEPAREGYPPVDIDCDGIEGIETLNHVNYGTDLPNFRESGSRKRYLYGPGSILVAHSDHEVVAIKDLKQAVKDYKTLIKAVLQ